MLSPDLSGSRHLVANTHCFASGARSLRYVRLRGTPVEMTTSIQHRESRIQKSPFLRAPSRHVCTKRIRSHISVGFAHVSCRARRWRIETSGCEYALLWVWDQISPLHPPSADFGRDDSEHPASRIKNPEVSILLYYYPSTSCFLCVFFRQGLHKCLDKKELSRLAGIPKFCVLRFDFLVWLRPLGRDRFFVSSW
jgi:hypothetical protein